eukprot:Gregarina_sp_Poly_1__1724@NODE_1444_length_4133_cov_160_835957_g144_i1_p3_GENE_NODE_1444_length_4133_cov_160_835957_g144_i1NODE_1444_length_4133_cov_160_835957_g144_i1_p3_ORF_typecomplete_len163_score16_25_NODE_1444_length_4133_cov_160_835957_g144_i18491337
MRVLAQFNAFFHVRWRTEYDGAEYSSGANISQKRPKKSARFNIPVPESQAEFQKWRQAATNNLVGPTETLSILKEVAGHIESKCQHLDLSHDLDHNDWPNSSGGTDYRRIESEIGRKLFAEFLTHLESRPELRLVKIVIGSLLFLSLTQFASAFHLNTMDRN